jgi:hypothetical protein
MEAAYLRAGKKLMLSAFNHEFFLSPSMFAVFPKIFSSLLTVAVNGM